MSGAVVPGRYRTPRTEGSLSWRLAEWEKLTPGQQQARLDATAAEHGLIDPAPEVPAPSRKPVSFCDLILELNRQLADGVRRRPRAVKR
jgi:hypothetical protein